MIVILNAQELIIYAVYTFVLYCFPVQQAAGKRLKELIADRTVGFYISPFVRSRQTFEGIREAFSNEQVSSIQN